MPVTNNRQIEVQMCDVCFLLDGDERLKVGTFCKRCGKFICEDCAPKKMRRAMAMLKGKLHRIMFTTSMLLILSIATHAQPSPSQFELQCSSGSSPLLPNGWTLNPQTNLYRAWVCVNNTNGHVSSPVFSSGGGGTPGTPLGSIQGNNTGAFGGVPGSSIDFTNGLISLAPPGTGIALSITGDASGSNLSSFFVNGSSIPGMEIESFGDAVAIGMILQESDTGFSAIGPHQYTITTADGSNPVFLSPTTFGTGNELDILQINPAADATEPGIPSLTVFGDNLESDIADFNDDNSFLILRMDTVGNTTISPSADPDGTPPNTAMLNIVGHGTDESFISLYTQSLSKVYEIDQNGTTSGSGYISVDTTFTSDGGCTESNLTGGTTAGKFTVGTSSTCNIVISLTAAPNGWHCSPTDLTHPATVIHETTPTTNAKTFVITSPTMNDVIEFACIGY